MAAAEEPVTARIHRQTGAVSSPRPQSEPEVTASPSVPSPRLAEPAAAAESTEPAPVVIAFPNTAHRTPGATEDRLPGARRPRPAAEQPPVKLVLTVTRLPS